MKDELNIGKFTELTGAEAEMVDGGSVLSRTFEMIYNGVRTLAKPFPAVGTALANALATLFTAIDIVLDGMPLFDPVHKYTADK